MLFNSYVFILYFLPVTLLGYYGLNRFEKYRAANVWLCFASLFFYGFFNWAYLLVILSSICFNFFIGRCVNTSGGVIYRRSAANGCCVWEYWPI